MAIAEMPTGVQLLHITAPVRQSDLSSLSTTGVHHHGAFMQADVFGKEHNHSWSNCF